MRADVTSSFANNNLSAPLQNREYDVVAQTAAARAEGDPILDWGCGEGQIAHRLHVAGADVTLYDYDPEAEGIERIPLQRWPGLVAQRSSEPVGLPYDDGQFAVVVSCGVLEHVAEPLASLRELRRVLRPGGHLLVYKLPNQLSALEVVARVSGMPYHGMRVHDTLWGVRSTRWALSAAGFEVVRVQRSNYLPLTVDRLGARANGLWRLNRALGRVPGVRLLATNIEAEAIKPTTVVRREISS